MKESVLDVLMYLFENYVETEFSDETNHINLRVELVAAGFPEEEVDHAFRWLNDLADQRSLLPFDGAVGAVRVYTGREVSRLSTESRGFIMYLEQLGILSAQTRELVLDRLMSIDDEIDIERVKWVVLLVLINQPGAEDAAAQVEDMVYYEGDFLH
jgi:Smg protein